MSGTLSGRQIQFATAVKRRGTLVTLRRATTTGGPAPLAMPPVCENPLVSATKSQGSTSLNISAAAANGALVAGDQMVINGNTYTITSQVAAQPNNSTSPGFLNVPFAPGLLASVAAATPITFIFSLDQSVYVTVSGYNQALIDGTVIQAADLQFTIASWSLAAGGVIVPPNQSDQIIFDGTQFGIVNVLLKLIQGTVVGYLIQARA
jgi:hypothetical protein